VKLEVQVEVNHRHGVEGDAIGQVVNLLSQIAHHLHHLVTDGASVGRLIHESENRLMSALSDKITAVGTSLDAAIARVQSDVATLTQKIADLQALVDQGTATPEDIAALDMLKSKLDGLDPTVPEVLPEPTP
jgi:hypothetical protein